MNLTARPPRLAMTAGLSWLALAFTARALPVVQTVFHDMHIVAAPECIAGRPDLDRGRTAWIGFSHGTQTGMNALLDASVDLGDYEVGYIDLVDDGNGGFVEGSVKKPLPAPARIPRHLPVPRFRAFHYGGGGRFGNHGQASSREASPPWSNGTGPPVVHPAPVAERMFFRLHSRPAGAPVDEPENAGFLPSHDDLDLQSPILPPEK